jgi:hypothetical protein
VRAESMFRGILPGGTAEQARPLGLPFRASRRYGYALAAPVTLRPSKLLVLRNLGDTPRTIYDAGGTRDTADFLEEKGLIARAGTTPPNGPGRPAILYVRTPAGDAAA